jgi:cation transport protein ChaC
LVDDKPKWVFGYASLMWDPGFDYERTASALVYGYHRALAVYSFLYRGTRESPGLVAGLIPGGSCRGMAFQVAAKNWPKVEKYLYDREMVYGVYIPSWMQGDIDGERQSIYGFVANPDHEQFAGNLSESDVVNLIINGQGIHGSGVEYVENTIAQMDRIGIHDGALRRIMTLVQSKMEQR